MSTTPVVKEVDRHLKERVDVTKEVLLDEHQLQDHCAKALPNGKLEGKIRTARKHCLLAATIFQIPRCPDD